MPNHLASARPQPNQRIIAPYVTEWTGEKDPPLTLIERPSGGIAYVDETVVDRDRNGVLWLRTPFRRGEGRPEFGRVHPGRQRHAMLRLLCQVCAAPADRADDGVLWLLQDHREDWPGWPDRMGVTEPPICRACVRTSVRLCPALRRGAAVIRAGRFPVVGVDGLLYRGGIPPVAVGNALLSLDDPGVRWILASRLVRELEDCRILRLVDLIDA